MIKDYLFQNWLMILVLLAFAVALQISVFLDKKTIRRLYILIVFVFLLSIVVFLEFNVAVNPEYKVLRSFLMAIRYSATPLIIALLIFTLVKKTHWYLFIPAIILTIIDFVSIPTGIVFKINDDNTFSRGALGYLPFIVAGLYAILLVFLLLKRSNKKWMEIFPIVFLSITLISGLVFPFVFGSDFSKIFCSTIAVALFIYYVFEILQQTKKDSLTGLLNRQAYNTDIEKNTEDITSLVSIDMNGLKTINDTLGHAAGDEALLVLSLCINRSLKVNQFGYRIGGDEFMILCRKTSRYEVTKLIERIEHYVKDTKYYCAIGYSYSENGEKTIKEMINESDMMMYDAKEKYYKNTGKDRRK